MRTYNKYDNLVIILDAIFGLFPRIQTKYVTKISSLIYMFYNLSNLGTEMQDYLLSRKAIFIFITYFLGKDSPCFEETKINSKDTWGFNRGFIAGGERMTEMIYVLYNAALKSSSSSLEVILLHFKYNIIFFIINFIETIRSRHIMLEMSCFP